jgi:hypothetical protein
MIEEANKRKVIFRYTNLPSLIDILIHKRLTLLSPLGWEDKNDTDLINEFLRRTGYKSLRALCFTQETETFHHWKIFASGEAGIRVDFHESAIQSAASQSGVTFRPILYKTVNEFTAHPLSLDDLPFIKRNPYRHEGEMRLISVHEAEESSSAYIPIGVDAIDEITLSPFLHKDLSIGLKSVLRNIDGCSDLKINHSKLIEYDRWINHAKK